MSLGLVVTRRSTNGGAAVDDIEQAHRTQVWYATSDEPAATVSGRYFFHQKLRDPDPATKGRRTTGSVARPMSESFRHCFEGAVTEGGSMSWYSDIDEGKLEGEISWDLELGWEHYIGEGRFVGMHRFDASGKIADVYKKFDINAEAVVRAAHETLAEVAAL
jgi:hypothetical protein